MHTENLGTFARGSNNFMYPFWASNGMIYLTTYGPRPAKFYEIDPDTGAATTYEPGDYQLRMLAETSDGHIWTVSNYEDFLYEFDPISRSFVGAYKWPVRGDNMVCIADADDRIYTVKNRRIYSFDARRRTFREHGEVMPERFVYNRGQHAQFGPDGNLYGVSDTTLFRFDPRTDEVRQIITQDGIAPNILILLGNLHVGALRLPWLHGTAWVVEGSTRWQEQPIRFSHHLLFRCDVETGAVETYPMARGEMGHSGFFYDPVDDLHYFGTPVRGGLVLNGLSWDRREVVRRIELPYGDHGVLVGQSRRPRHLLLCLSFLGVLIELDLATGRHRKLFDNPQPAEVRALAVGRGRRAFGITYDCGHVFERRATPGEVGRSLGVSYIFRICYGPGALSRNEAWLLYPINCGMGIRGTGLMPTEGAPVGRHVTDLVPIHIAPVGDEAFLVVHRGPWYIHQEEGRWDGSDETVPSLARTGQGVFRLHAPSGAVEALPDVPCASLAGLPDGSVVGCDAGAVWRLAAGASRPEPLCSAPIGALRVASAPDGALVALATESALFTLDIQHRTLERVAGLPFPPERGLFCFDSGAIVAVGQAQSAVLSRGSRTPTFHDGALPGKVGPVAPPDEEALYTVDRDLFRFTWR